MNEKKIIDCTMLIEEGMQTFPTHWHPMVEICQLGRHGLENRETRKVVLGTHTGTHIDAPRHFIKNGKTIDSILLDQTVGPAECVDLSDLPPRTEVTVDILRARLQGPVPERLVCYYGWDDKLGTNDYYSECPFLSKDLASWLVESGCLMVAMDTPMPDNPKNGRGAKEDSPVHKILLGAGVLIVEYLVNLEPLAGKEFLFCVAPLKIASGDGAPVRAFAIL